MNTVLSVFGLMLLVDLVVLYMGGHLWKHRQKNKKNTSKKWYNNTYRNEVHITPLNDLIDHEPENCACGPKTEPVELSDGTINWQVIHNALDGRK